MIKTDPAIGRVMAALWIGIALLVLGFLAGVVFPALNMLLFQGTPSGATVSVVRISQFGFFVIGIGMLLMAYAGIRLLILSRFSSDAEKPIRTIEYGYVIAKVCETEDRLTVYDPDMFDPLELNYYVQVAYEGGREEFQTGRAVFDSIGEGMNGNFTVQGKWLNSFQFVPRRDS